MFVKKVFQLVKPFLANLQFGNNWKKVNPEKVICQKLLQVSSIEEDKLQFCKLLLPVTLC